MDAHTTIRQATETDAVAVLEIYRWSVENESASFEFEAPSLPEMTQRMATVIEAGLPYLVAQREGTVVGFAYASPYRHRPGYRFTVENTVYVSRSARGSGVGKVLILTLINNCEAMGFRQMLAVIGGSNTEPSIRLHGSCGFEEVGRCRSIGFKHGAWHDVVTMQRALGPGDTSPGLEVAEPIKS